MDKFIYFFMIGKSNKLIHNNMPNFEREPSHIDRMGPSRGLPAAKIFLGLLYLNRAEGGGPAESGLSIWHVIGN